MDVILQENYPSLGYIGDHVNVRPGFARNFLIPRGIAVEANTPNARLLAHRMAGINAKKAKLKAEADTFAKRLVEVKLEFVLRTGDKGRSFGSVTSKEIFDELTKQGIEINRKQIRLTEVIKKAGEYSVGIKLHSEVTATVPVKVTSEAASTPSKAAAGKEERKARGKKRKSAEGAAEESASAVTQAEKADDVANATTESSEE